MLKILTVVGARPQFIKAASISREISKYSDIKEVIVHTGQHFDNNMSDIFFDEMKIPKPNYNLNINGLSHGAMTGQMLEKIEVVLYSEKPDVVLVYGDTNSTIAGALAAAKLHIKVAHIEAGLRSYNNFMPEEINRILTDRISNILFCPTETAILNLSKEGFGNSDCNIVKSGDVMLDTALFYSEFESKPLFQLPEKFILATIHRAENTGKLVNLKSIISALEEINESISVILPLHPGTRNIIHTEKINTGNILIVEPVGYFQIVYLLRRAQMILTDSGGMQKEAFFFKKNCITLRQETEWVELVENNFNKLAGSDKKLILDVFENHRFNKDFDINLYGNGEASKLIVEYLKNY